LIEGTGVKPLGRGKEEYGEPLDQGDCRKNGINERGTAIVGFIRSHSEGREKWETSKYATKKEGTHPKTSGKCHLEKKN